MMTKPAAESAVEMKQDPETLLTVPEVAALLKVSHAYVRQHSSGFRQPTIPSVKLGSSVRFQRRDVLKFINSMKRIAS